MLRATFKSLLSRKLRLILSGLAVVLGVMFVAGSFVLTSTLTNSFDSLFANAYSHVAVQVSGVPKVDDSDDSGQAIPANVPAGLIDRIKGVPGVAGATGIVQADGAHVIGSNGKVLATSGAPRFGTNWTGTSTLMSIKDGRAPAADDEIVVDNGVLADGDLRIGQQVGVSVYGVKHTFTLVGTFVYSGDRDSLGGEQTVAFTTPVAQKLMLGATGQFTAIDVKPAAGISDTTLRINVASALGHGYTVQTGAQLAAKSTASLASSLSFVKDIFLGFAGVALFVGIFLILNTFSIIVAQRTKELALLRALGGSRRQMIGSVLIEALVIGVVASTIGLAAGFGVGVLLAYVFSHVGNGSLQLTGVGLPASAVIAAYAVGITITLIAALLPALRAARIAPVAAMREAATPDRPLTRMTVVGTIILAVGGALLGTGLAGAGGNTLTLIVAGVMIAFVGVAVLTPAISRPVVAALGAALSWSIPGMLGKRNSARNPRRTAITAAALMVGIALIGGISIVLQSTKVSATGIATDTVKADLVIAGSDNGSAFDPSVLTRSAAIPGVHEVLALYQDAALVNGRKTYVAAISDQHPLTDIYSLKTVGGSIASVGPDQILVDAPTATKLGLHIGDPVTVQLTHGDPITVTLSGTYAKNLLTSGWVLNAGQAGRFRIDQPYQAFIQVDKGANVGAIKKQVGTLLANSPEVNVDDYGQYVNQQASGINTVMTWIQILLALAILIAILGVINTLALSVLERTREIGLLRAIGLSRAKTMWMVTVESIVISVFGALLGLAVGTGLGVSVVRALHSKGIKDLSVPYQQMVVIVILAAIVGVIAAILPAIRAARTNVLAAISYE
ncbi:MAG TPA: FtsX-like permease family protein [Micromonosporaceae bacterium]